MILLCALEVLIISVLVALLTFDFTQRKLRKSRYALEEAEIERRVRENIDKTDEIRSKMNRHKKGIDR